VAHVDIYRTWAALAGRELTPKQEAQVEGLNLLPLLENPRAEWPDRVLFTHLGRWPKGTQPDAAKYRNASVRTPRYHLVSALDRPRQQSEPVWRLFDVKEDPAEQVDLAREKPEMIQALLAQYDAWWQSLRGQIDLNEQARGPQLNPFAELYWRQFGGGPTEADRERMNPDHAWNFEAWHSRRAR
jgi:arylsulfatase A-like enzyme